MKPEKIKLKHSLLKKTIVRLNDTTLQTIQGGAVGASQSCTCCCTGTSCPNPLTFTCPKG